MTNQPTKPIELNKCGKCGAKAQAIEHEPNQDFWVECSNPLCQNCTPDTYSDEQSAVEIWNALNPITPPPQPAAEPSQEEVEKLAEDFYNQTSGGAFKWDDIKQDPQFKSMFVKYARFVLTREAAFKAGFERETERLNSLIVKHYNTALESTESLDASRLENEGLQATIATQAEKIAESEKLNSSLFKDLFKTRNQLTLARLDIERKDGVLLLVKTCPEMECDGCAGEINAALSPVPAAQTNTKTCDVCNGLGDVAGHTGKEPCMNCNAAGEVETHPAPAEEVVEMDSKIMETAKLMFDFETLPTTFDRLDVAHAVIWHKYELVSQLSTQAARIKELEAALWFEKETIESLKRLDAATSPFCEHNAQFSWSPDGQGKKIICLRCENKTLREQLNGVVEAAKYVCHCATIPGNSIIEAMQQMESTLSAIKHEVKA